MEHYPSAIINYPPYLFVCNFSYQWLRIVSDFNIFLRTVFNSLDYLAFPESILLEFGICKTELTFDKWDNGVTCDLAFDKLIYNSFCYQTNIKLHHIPTPF